MAEPSTPRMHELDALLRRYAAAAGRIGRAFCERHDMHPTDFQALGLIMDAERQGEPITPAELTRALSMSSGAVSAAIDRLERAGHVRRSRESADKRRVHLHYTGEGMGLALTFFGPLGTRTAEVRARYSEAELAVVGRFLTDMDQAMRRHLDALEHEDG